MPLQLPETSLFYVLGCDPAIAAFGWSFLSVRALPSRPVEIQVERVGVWYTQPRGEEDGRALWDVNGERVQRLAGLAEKEATRRPEGTMVRIVAEARAFGPGADSVQLVLGMLHTISRALVHPGGKLVLLAPQTVRARLSIPRTKDRKQGKVNVAEAVQRALPADWTTLLHGIPPSDQNHAFDATAAALAALAGGDVG